MKLDHTPRLIAECQQIIADSMRDLLCANGVASNFVVLITAAGKVVTLDSPSLWLLGKQLDAVDVVAAIKVTIVPNAGLNFAADVQTYSARTTSGYAKVRFLMDWHDDDKLTHEFLPDSTTRDATDVRQWLLG